jgi:isohexenylglutaconyl-CoA hydratase
MTGILLPQVLLPKCETLKLEHHGWWLGLTLNRPERRNAMNGTMVEEIMATFDSVADRQEIRLVVLRGAAGVFSAGADIKERASIGALDEVARRNARGGELFRKVDRAPQVVAALIEGPAMAGAFGLVCCADVALALNDAVFALPETAIGIAPAQIAPFLVRRIGIGQTRRLALTAARFGATEALQMGLVHGVYDSVATLEAGFATQVLDTVRRCAPGAIRVTKELLRSAGRIDDVAYAEMSSRRFADLAQGPEGVEGARAFAEKRKPAWAQG